MKILSSTLLLFTPFFLAAQCWNLVWEDEFTGNALNQNLWEYEIGTGTNGWGNNEEQYYTSSNAIVSGGTLKIIAEEDATHNYISSRIRTKYKSDFRYGKMEARMKLPVGQGIWPAFWMLPSCQLYGGWPHSGEIDIMENIGQQPSTLYGTCHFSDENNNHSSSGNSTNLASGTFADNFHVFTVEWEPTQIRWYLDGTLYHTISDTDAPFTNANWPFDEYYHFILNVAVGGNWPGSPDGTTVFPQQMEVDWVRVYQLLNDMEISGRKLVAPSTTNELYAIPTFSGATYTWSVPTGASILSGQGTNSITVNWGTSSGTISVNLTNACGSQTIDLPVEVSSNMWTTNWDFECGFQTWGQSLNNGGNADFYLDLNAPQEGNVAACVSVNGNGSPVYSWNIQLIQDNIPFVANESYTGTFWAKGSGIAGQDVSFSFVNSATNSYITTSGVIPVTDTWQQYSYTITAPNTETAKCTINMGDESGTFCFDDLFFSQTALLPVEYVDFWAENIANKSIELNWLTQFEEDLAFFEIQCSKDGQTWAKIETIAAKGEANHYKLLDTKPFQGENYYRIRNVNRDGSSEFSAVVQAFLQANNTPHIYPNPVQNELYIEGEHMEYVRLFSLDGQLQKELKLPLWTEKTRISLADLPKGVYLIEIVGEGVQYREKLLKIKD